MKKFDVKEMENRLEMAKWSASISSTQDFKTGGTILTEKVTLEL